MEFEKPFPVQKPSTVARKMVKGIEEGKEKVSPCGLFDFSKVLMGVIPPVRTVYWKHETEKLERFKRKLEARREKLRGDARLAVEKGREAAEELREREREARKELDEKAAKVREEIKEKIHGG